MHSTVNYRPGDESGFQEVDRNQRQAVVVEPAKQAMQSRLIDGAGQCGDRIGALYGPPAHTVHMMPFGVMLIQVAQYLYFVSGGIEQREFVIESLHRFHLHNINPCLMPAAYLRRSIPGSIRYYF